MLRSDDVRDHDVVYIQVPNVEGVLITCDRQAARFTEQKLEAAAKLVSYVLLHSDSEITPSMVRTALRRLYEPQQLGATPLAYTLFDNVMNPTMRGNALRRLLVTAIDQLNVTPADTPKERRPYLVLHNLYVKQRFRHQVAKILGLSERQYQRLLRQALIQLVEIISRER